jgi:hypothetical protein
MYNYDIFYTFARYLRYKDIISIAMIDDITYFATLYLIDNPQYSGYMKIKILNNNNYEYGLYLSHIKRIVIYTIDDIYIQYSKSGGKFVQYGYQYGYDTNYNCNYINISLCNFITFDIHYKNKNRIRAYMKNKLYIVGFKRGVKHGRELVIDLHSYQLLYYAIYNRGLLIAQFCKTDNMLYVANEDNIHIYKNAVLFNNKYKNFSQSVMTRYGYKLCDILNWRNNIKVDYKNRYKLFDTSYIDDICGYKFDYVIEILGIMQ